MAVATIEGTVKNGRIQLQNHVTLPENAKVYVVIPDLDAVVQAHVYSPRLAHSEQAVDFVKQVMEADADDKL